jgi:hypothetical protein
MMKKESHRREIEGNQPQEPEPKLIVKDVGDQKSITLDLPWHAPLPGSKAIKILGKQNQFYDRILTFAGLPEQEDLPKILQLAQESGIPAIWHRARPSRLEEHAATLFTALAFSNRRKTARLVRTLFHDLGIGVELRGRPRKTAAKLKYNIAGPEIDKLVLRLGPGFNIKRRIMRRGGYESGSEFCEGELKRSRSHYQKAEIKAIVRQKTAQAAAYSLYQAKIHTEDGVSLSLDTIRANHNRYKRLHKQRLAD